ncbi:MAG: N-6 DNA methylase [Methanosarcina sp.]|uniref:Eco57I restriction-modification methylase domain-containing protein n=1 Tax=Methanosarcina sp. TaxID=2213 RepID=UPI0026077C2F|nr:DNA methyltransferase [Methanosarcina sp.]MDD3247488.1 N-6 DNA methylase [Methanosarcina sp.]MDD4247747.1 N-6 DNA methylase [Methanosarcina sp.]
MQPLEKTLRNKLERTVKEARDIAEAAARASLEQLGVGEASPFPYLTEDQKELRRKLRAHGRQLGDQRDPKAETQEIERLVEEVAYEHWHRMLFARFLAENNLLMYPDPVDPVAVTLEECEDLAADEGAKNGWELASRYAARMLPQIFRPDSPVFQLILPPEHQQKLERLLANLPSEVFTASDSMGWVYQFWQAKKKDEVNKSEVKIGARELPAVTQLFTEPYMVSFLLDNSLGAWWAARQLTEEDFKTATSEEGLRQKASLSGVPLEYLRFVKIEDGLWAPAAGTFDGWPENLSELKTLDPCCGSGHFLVAAFLMLVPIRMEMEGLSAQEAVDAVLRDNLHGLEIDQRCVELAAFALALTAWRYPGAGGYRTIPELHMACSGLSISTKKEEWLELAGDNNNLRMGLEELYKQFKNAPVLGSLINPEASLFRGTLIEMKWEELAPLLSRVLSGEKDDEKTEMGVVAQGVVKAAILLAGKYHWVVTNVPYLFRGKQSDLLKDYCEEKYPAARNDLATVFLARCLEYCTRGGSTSIVLPQNWFFLNSYKKFRIELLKEDTWNLIARLGSGAFETISGEVVKAILISISRGNITPSMISSLDAAEPRQPAEKAETLRNWDIRRVEQAKQLENPDSRVVLDKLDSETLLSRYSDCFAGVLNGDSPRFQKKFWEIIEYGELWVFQQTTVGENKQFGGQELVLFYDLKEGHIREDAWIRREKLHDSDQRGNRAWGKWGIAISQMRILPVSLYTGATFDSNIAVIYPADQSLVLPIWAYCQSYEYNEAVRQIDQSLKVTNATLVKVPFDLDHWTKVAAEKYPHGLPKPYSEDPTQWIFHGHPAKSGEPLQVAVARLLGYRWPAELDADMELSDEARAWVKKCDDLFSYADEDGIVCIPPVRGETSAADQLLNLLAAAYGDSWSNDKLSKLLKQADHADKPLETWLREKFFTQHCKIFQHRPFIWHIWDGLRDGFAALVNYHKLDKKLLETLIYTYLGDWISRQKQDIANGVDGSQEKLDAAENLKKKLELILEGEAPYDIFVRWKPIEKQPIGWDPDLNDGVRMNIRPFMSVTDVGKKGAGVLKEKPNINWNKDRGKDVESAPWYNPDPQKHPSYKGKEGDRINDYHLSLQQKREAREAAK